MKRWFLISLAMVGLMVSGAWAEGQWPSTSGDATASAAAAAAQADATTALGRCQFLAGGGVQEAIGTGKIGYALLPGSGSNLGFVSLPYTTANQRDRWNTSIIPSGAVVTICGVAIYFEGDQWNAIDGDSADLKPRLTNVSDSATQNTFGHTVTASYDGGTRYESDSDWSTGQESFTATADGLLHLHLTAMTDNGTADNNTLVAGYVIYGFLQ